MFGTRLVLEKVLLIGKKAFDSRLRKVSLFKDALYHWHWLFPKPLEHAILHISFAWVLCLLSWRATYWCLFSSTGFAILRIPFATGDTEEPTFMLSDSLNQHAPALGSFRRRIICLLRLNKIIIFKRKTIWCRSGKIPTFCNEALSNFYRLAPPHFIP